MGLSEGDAGGELTMATPLQGFSPLALGARSFLCISASSLAALRHARGGPEQRRGGRPDSRRSCGDGHTHRAGGIRIAHAGHGPGRAMASPTRSAARTRRWCASCRSWRRPVSPWCGGSKGGG